MWVLILFLFFLMILQADSGQNSSGQSCMLETYMVGCDNRKIDILSNFLIKLQEIALRMSELQLHVFHPFFKLRYQMSCHFNTSW